MTYHEHGINLTKGQADKLQRAAKKGCPFSIHLSHAKLRGEHKMWLTTRQVQKIAKLLQKGTGGMVLELSATQLKENMQKVGGFLPMLAGLAMRALPMLAKTILPALGVGALSGLGGVAVNKALWSGLYLKRGGCVCTVKPSDKGLYLKPSNARITYGDGLYLKRGQQFHDGAGLILGANSPFKNIPLLEEVIHSNDAFAPVSYLNLQSVHVEDKHFDMKKRLTSRLDHYPMKRSSDIHKEIFSENEPRIHESEICELDTPYKCPESTDLIKLQVKQREKDIWITGVTVKRERGKTTEEMTCLAMNKLKECMLERTGNWSLSDLCMINLYISDMNDFGAINDIYKKYFGLNPPARVCVQVPLPENIVLQLECYGSCNEDKHTMHVQSISHWAPANIGPYSQAVKVDKRMYIAGQIAMVPSTLNIISGGIRAESRLCLRHIHRILEAMPGSTSLKNISIAICYVSQRDYISIVKKEMKYAGHTFLNHNHSSFSIENNTMPSMIEFVVVPRLPRNAKVEWKVYSDITDILSIENTIFHLSDQLKSTGKYKVTNSSLSCIVKVDRSGNQFERPDLSRAVKCFYQCYEKIVQSSEVEWKSLPALSIFYSVLSSFSYDHLIKELSCQLNKDIIFTIVPVIEFSSETTLLVGCH
ncbi:DPH6 [Mytilus edulis]|uniref:DPH6 n=1 Tax=Mytilus edulis TaxID=6550 RepID=A0A8S3PPV2_MYTED|nr:DPH6 [Mytilus edulis]